MDDEDWDAEITPANCKPATSYTQTTTFTTQTTSSIAPQSNSFGSSSFSRPQYANNYGDSNSGKGRGSLFRSNRNDENSSRQSYNNYNNYDDNNNPYNNKSSSSFTETLNVDAKSISSLIGKGGSTINEIREKCNVKIHVPPREAQLNKNYAEIKIVGQSREAIERAMQMIKEKSNENSNYSSSSSYSSRPNYSSQSRFDQPRNRSNSANRYHPYESSTSNRDENYKSNQSSYNSSNNESQASNQESKSNQVTIDWDLVRAQPLQNMSKFKDQPAVVKDFYEEHPEIAAMTREEVIEFRKSNFNIMVELFKKNLGYGKKEEDTRTPEEIEDYLFKTIPKPVKTIEQAFGRFPDIIEECKRQKFLQPTPIQSQLWPILLKGLDCVGIAQTGTGKTLAFLLPALIHIDNQTTPRNKRLGPNCLVLSPTRELAIQIEQEVKKINYKGIKSVCVYGGGDRKEQADLCTKGVEIIIATPGRLYDLIQAGIINVISVTYLVLDEADRMLDLGFEPQIMKILLDIRPDRQTVMTSATWPEGVRRLATKYLNEPIQLYVGSLDLRAASSVTQHLEMVRSDDEKKELLMKFVEEMQEDDKLIVFVGRKALADNLSCDLIIKNIQCQSIHGDREQCDREEALQDFKEGRVRILIATDVASRGIDVKDITCVLNYDFPRNIEEYVHRVGRTGRAGRRGTAITFMAREDWKHAKELIDILKQGEQDVPQALVDMAERYEAMLKKKNEEGGGGGRSRFGSSGGRFNRGNDGGYQNRGGFENNNNSGYNKSERSGGFQSSFNDNRNNNNNRGNDAVFIPRGRRADRKDDDLGGFVF